MNVERITWEEISDIWETELWPGRASKIEPVSTIMYGFWPYLYDYWELKIQLPSFFGVFEGNNLVAVNSGHAAWKMYRSRGLYVHPLYRGLGLGKKLLLATIEQARLEKKRFVWSIPRKDSLPAYESVGFQRTTEWFETETAQLNCFVLLPL